MRVVVTRPKHSGLRTAQRLIALGHNPVLLPLTEPVHDAAAAKLALAEPHSALAVTSAEAIAAMAALGATLKPHLHTRLFTVGKATADAARQHGFTRVQTSGAGGAELADLIATECRGLADPKNPLLYLAGLPRAPAFEQHLTANGIPWRVAQCYAMTPVLRDAVELQCLLLAQRADAILLYSFETARTFFGLPLVTENTQAFAGTRFLCLSTHVAEAIPDRFCSQVAVAQTPDEAALFALL